jgi:hypothetical protein
METVKTPKANLARVWFFACEAAAAFSLFIILASNGRAQDFYWDILLCASAVLLVTSALMTRADRRLTTLGVVTSIAGLLVALLCPHLIE